MASSAGLRHRKPVSRFTFDEPKPKLDQKTIEALLKHIETTYNLIIDRDEYSEILPDFVRLFQTGEPNRSLSHNPKYLNSIGLYYQYVTKNYWKMEQFYKKAIEKGDSSSMNNMGWYHHNNSKRYSEMEKYYQMAIAKGNALAMNNMGWYHHRTTKNYGEMKKYYQMAIKKGSSISMCNMGDYHHYVTKNYPRMEHYYTMAIEKGNSNALVEFGLYHQYTTNNYREVIKYYLMAIRLKNKCAEYRMDTIIKERLIETSNLHKNTQRMFIELALEYNIEYMNDKWGKMMNKWISCHLDEKLREQIKCHLTELTNLEKSLVALVTHQIVFDKYMELRKLMSEDFELSID